MTPNEQHRAALAHKTSKPRNATESTTDTPKRQRPAERAATPSKAERDNRVSTVQEYHEPERPVSWYATNGMGGGRRVYVTYLPKEAEAGLIDYLKSVNDRCS